MEIVAGMDVADHPRPGKKVVEGSNGDQEQQRAAGELFVENFANFSAYVEQQRSIYAYELEYDLWLDVMAFEDMFAKLAKVCQSMSFVDKNQLKARLELLFLSTGTGFYTQLIDVGELAAILLSWDLSAASKTQPVKHRTRSENASYKAVRALVVQMRGWSKSAFFKLFENEVTSGNISGDRIHYDQVERMFLKIEDANRETCLTTEERKQMSKTVRSIFETFGTPCDNHLTLGQLSRIVNYIAYLGKQKI